MFGVVMATVARTLSGWDEVAFDGENFTFKGPLFNFVQPKAKGGKGFFPFNNAFWQDVRQAHFDLAEAKTDKVRFFLQRWGPLREEEDRPGADLILPVGRLKQAVTWFQTLTALWENVRVGRAGYIREVLSAPDSKEPWAAYIPPDGEKPYLSIYNPPFRKGLYAFPKDDGAALEETARFIMQAFTEFLQRIPLTVEVKGTQPFWCFQPQDWLEVAVCDFYLEQMAGNRLCKCGCGLPARPRGDYFNDTHAASYRKRKQRERKKGAGVCPVCGHTLEGEEVRRAAQIISNLKKDHTC
jgi:hypothetical protein